MGNVVCGAKEGETLDEGDETGQEKKLDSEFCQNLYQRISETDSAYERDFEADEPKPEPNRISVCQFKRWAARTAKCHPLWRRSMKSNETINLQDFEKAISADKEHVLLGQLLMDIKLAGGDGELMQPHLKAREHWFGWEVDKIKKYYQQILTDAGKSIKNDDTLTLDDIKTFGNKQNCIDIRIDYAFGYTEWNEAQKRLDHKDANAPRYVSYSVREMQEAYKQKGPHQELGKLLKAFAAAVAEPGTHQEEVSKNDMFYWDPEAAVVDDGSYPDLDGDEGDGEEKKELKTDPKIEEGHAFPSLNPSGDKEQPAQPQPAADQPQQDQPAQPQPKDGPDGPSEADKGDNKPQESSAYPSLG